MDAGGPFTSDRVFGVDFSAALNAGRLAWIAAGVVEKDELRVESVRPCRELPGSGSHRDLCLPALASFIRDRPGAVFGLDFPFGLPRRLIGDRDWSGFLRTFPERHPTADLFRGTCRAMAGGAELKRRTDREMKTPFSAYNLRLYRQTWHGIRHLLHPLVTGRHVDVVPMQAATQGRAWLVEICPASTLRREGLRRPYKGKGPDRALNRERILEALLDRGGLRLGDPSLRSAVVHDRGGDALDSIIAARAAFHAVREGLDAPGDGGGDYRLEGCVYA